VASTESLSQDGQDAADPQLDVGPDGTATVVWKRFDGAHYEVEERRLSPAGDPLPAGSSNVLSDPAQDAVEPAVAASPDGGATVVWSRFDSARTIVQARRIGPSGAPEATTSSLSAEGQNAVGPQVAVAPGGVATVVWTRFDGSHWVIQDRRLSAAGAPEGVVANLSNNTRDAAEPQLAVGADGKVTVVWDRHDGTSFVVQARRIDAAGALAAATLNLSAAGRDAGEPQVDVAPNGTATVLWSRFDGANFIVQRRDVAVNETLSTTSNLSAAGRRASGPAVAWGSGGTLMTSWRRFASSGDAVQAAPLSSPFPSLPPVPPPPPAEEEEEPTPPPVPPPVPPVEEAAAGDGVKAGASLPTPSLAPAIAAAAGMRVEKVIINRRRGTARLVVQVSGPGRLTLKGAVPRDQVVETAGTVTLKLAPRPAQRRALERDGRQTMKVTVSFEPLAGDAIGRSLIVRLRSSR
jgi:hypothetical protein